jgi:hypothetical protein
MVRHDDLTTIVAPHLAAIAAAGGPDRATLGATIADAIAAAGGYCEPGGPADRAVARVIAEGIDALPKNASKALRDAWTALAAAATSQTYRAAQAERRARRAWWSAP